MPQFFVKKSLCFGIRTSKSLKQLAATGLTAGGGGALREWGPEVCWRSFMQQ